MVMTGEMRVMDHTGDTKTTWDKDNADEVAAARALFAQLVGDKKFTAYKVDAGGDTGEQVREFDPEAGMMILRPPMAGG